MKTWRGGHTGYSASEYIGDDNFPDLHALDFAIRRSPFAWRGIRGGVTKGARGSKPLLFMHEGELGRRVHREKSRQLRLSFGIYMAGARRMQNAANFLSARHCVR